MKPNEAYHGLSSHVQLPTALSGLICDTVELLGNGLFERCAYDAVHALWEQRVAGGDVFEVEVAGLAPLALVHATGRGGAFPVMLVTPHWRLQLGPYGKGSAKLIFAAESLCAYGLEWATLEAKRIGHWIWGHVNHWRVQRVDIACDFVGTHVREFEDTYALVTRSAKVQKHREAGDSEEPVEEPSNVAMYETRREVTSVTMGSASSGVQVCIYDKTRQIKEVGIAWADAALRGKGWDGESTVTRVECRFRNRALDDFAFTNLRDIDNLARFHKWASHLWAYGTQKAVRYCTPTHDSNRARWPMREDWEAISCVLEAEVPKRKRVISAAIADERRRRASRDLVRAVERLAAESEETLKHATRMASDAVAAGQSPLVGMLAAVLSSGIDVEVRAMPRIREQDRAMEMLARAGRRRLRNKWQDDAYLSMALGIEPEGPSVMRARIDALEAAAIAA